jgi:hypothetical protein
MSRLNLWYLPPAFFLQGGPWVRPAPGIPRALCQGRQVFSKTRTRKSRREVASGRNRDPERLKYNSLRCAGLAMTMDIEEVLRHGCNRYQY